MTGRPTKKTPELLKEICSRISEGRSLSSICREDDMPNHTTTWRWLSEDSSFQEDYTRAIQSRALAHAERIDDLAEQAVRGEIPADVARVAIDAKKWTASRLLPKLYGDRTQVDATVTHTHTLHLEALKELANRVTGTRSGYIEGQATEIIDVPTFHGESAGTAEPAPTATGLPIGGPDPAAAGQNPPGPAPHRGAPVRAATPPSTDPPKKVLRPPRPPSRAKRAAAPKIEKGDGA
jgi:hypothetical protein